MDNKTLWEKIITDLRKSISHPNLITWFKDTAVIGASDDSVTVGAPTAFSERQLSGKFHDFILKSAKTVDPKIKMVVYRTEPELELKTDNRGIDFDFLIGDTARPKARKMPKKAEVKVGEFRSVMIDRKYTLDNFIVGPDNRLAHAASMAVSNEPGKNYNPLFIYGTVGMGKTHLLQAIGNEILKKHGNKTVIYQTSESFMNDYIQTLRQKKSDEFKNKYRKADVLLLDDVQFFKGKESTQEEFFHTFNALYMANKQIVLTADQPPQELKGLEERLVSRFEQGMVVDVQLPDFETRLAILQEKCHERGVMIPADVLEFIAENITQSIRELEGVLTQAIAESELESTMPTITSVAKYFKRLNTKKEIAPEVEMPKITKVSELIIAVSNYYDIDVRDMVGSTRKARIMQARQIAMYFARNIMGYTFEEIGEAFGGRDHTTVMHSIKKVELEKSSDKKYLQTVNAVKKSIGI